MNELFTNNQSSIVVSNRILYTASSFARSSLLHLQEIGELEAKRAHTSSRSGLKSYLLFTVVNGKGSLTYGGREYLLQQGDGVFIDCEKPYSHTTDAQHLWTLRWIHFYGPSLPVVYSKYCERGGRPVFHPKTTNEIDRVWSNLMTTASGDDYIRDMRINESLNILLTLIMAESWHPEEQESLPPKKRLILPVKAYMDKNYGKKITLDSLAARFFINKYYLTKTFKEQNGMSINAYLLDLRITKAKQLLRFTDKSVEEIGMECGLGTAHYFSSKFKEVEGVPPSVYREQW